MGRSARPAFWHTKDSVVLIRNAQVWQKGLADVRIAAGRISAIGVLQPLDGEVVVDAAGGALLPGLHDHHIHLAALAAKQASVACGPPDVVDESALANALQQPGDGWLRGIGYHESVAGMPDVGMLDRMVSNRPIRIQHRSGRMWFLNSLALDALLERAEPPSGLERNTDGFTGRLFDDDAWLRYTLSSTPPCFGAVSAQLAAMGVTGLTDMSPANDAVMANHFCAERHAGRLLQSSLLAGTLALADAAFDASLQLGQAKLHLHEAALPDLDETIDFIRQAHQQGRSIAVHCTTEIELVFALAAIEAAGVVRGDRIEHAGIAPDHLVTEIQRLGLWVVSQPHFISERGDQYAQDVEARDVPWLYRLRAFLVADVPLAAGSDAPFGSPDPWTAMAAAVSRSTRSGLQLGADEALTPDQALALFLSDPMDLTRQRSIELGAAADLCLLDRPWEDVRDRLSASDVRMTIAGGRIIHNRVDQAPA
jgi:predicted amidohydrolase YtcJ